MLKLGEILTLDNNKKYVVAGTTYHDNELYCYLVEMNNTKNTDMYLVKDNQLVQVIDENLIKELEISIANNIKEDL